MDDSSFDWALLARYFSGVASAHEERTLRRWTEADPSRAQLLESLRKMWEVSGGLPRRRDVDAAWTRVRTRIQGRGETPEDSRPGATGSPSASPVSIPIAPRSRRRIVPSAPLLRIAALFLIALLPALLLGPLRGAFHRAPEPVPVREIAAARGERKELHLGDGSRVILGPGSRLRYPAEFGARGRDLHLDGTAYFEVVRDPRRPFIVHANGALTQVLGTRFVVRAYPGEAVHVAVAEGRVALRAEGAPASRGVVLGQGQLGQVAEDGSTTGLPDAALDRYLSWIHGRVVIRNARLAEVAKELERWYDIEIRIADPVLASRLVTTSFGEESVGLILDLITVSLDARYQRSGKQITLLPRSH